MKTVILLGFTFSMLAGCATSSSVAPYAKDSYILSVEDASGGRSTSNLQVKAAQEASAYCAKQGKFMIVRNTRGDGVQWWTGTSSSLIFSCVDENDPEYKRPTLRKEADTVIEDRRQPK